MIEAAMIWNEPNNKSHWDPELDPGWARYAEMSLAAGRAIAQASPGLTRVLGGMSPIDPGFIRNVAARGVLEEVDVVGLHGFPLDWNLWQIDAWPEKLNEIAAVTEKPLWVTEAGVSSFGADEVQVWGLARTAELLTGKATRIHWYSLYDLPRRWGQRRATAKQRAAPIIAISPWACCARMAARSLLSTCSAASPRSLACASGSISKITGWMKPCAG